MKRLLLAALVSGLLPGQGWAMLAPAKAPVSERDRTSDTRLIRETLGEAEVRRRLALLGLDAREIDSRLSRLSDKQVHKLAKDLEALRPGGHERLFNGDRVQTHHFLVIVLIVLLILLIL